MGDSHAAALLAALEPQLDALNWRVTAFTGQTVRMAPPAHLTPDCPGLRADPAGTPHRHYAVVIATEIRVYPSSVADHLAGNEARRRHRRAHRGRRGRPQRVVRQQRPASTRITYSATGNCGTPVTVAYRDPDRLAQAAERIRGARVVRTRRFYCRDGFCPATIGNVLVYGTPPPTSPPATRRTLSPYLVEAIERTLHSQVLEVPIGVDRSDRQPRPPAEGSGMKANGVIKYRTLIGASRRDPAAGSANRRGGS